METNNLTNRQLEVINELKNEHLTSFQILNRINSIKLILVVYNVLDELKNMGILKSYMKQNVKYHYIESN
ncbi:hypothetical protein KO506_09855 [Polaribacter vadi]|uniref:hypothetical protein n=1 Tax=Polaribacter TaxID=52959 RepID=UPI001C0A216B|nr:MULTISPECIES: hypothetical protein [Polaribacter]MBU3011706.1 hypothetical protein [Polaribacter vadi]MDO6741519.1 hypothetical protein [Polaribacter sp. 1_MG-2023]